MKAETPQPSPEPEVPVIVPSPDEDERDDAFNEDLPNATLTTTAQEAVRATFVGGALGAARRIVAIARGEIAAPPQVQFSAQKYVIEYALGRPKESGASDRIDELTSLFSEDESAADEWIGMGIKE